MSPFAKLDPFTVSVKPLVLAVAEEGKTEDTEMLPYFQIPPFVPTSKCLPSGVDERALVDRYPNPEPTGAQV
jgi:hypothetical protein